MATETVVRCDRCSRKCPDSFSRRPLLSVVVGSRMDLASGRTETIDKYIDLCPQCLYTLASEVLSFICPGYPAVDKSTDNGNRFLKNLKSKKKMLGGILTD